MCSPKAPAATTVVTPPPSAAPQPMAAADVQDAALNLSQLRIGSRNNLRLRAPAAAGAGGLTIPTPVAAPKAMA